MLKYLCGFYFNLFVFHFLYNGSFGFSFFRMTFQTHGSFEYNLLGLNIGGFQTIKDFGIEILFCRIQINLKYFLFTSPFTSYYKEFKNLK